MLEPGSPGVFLESVLIPLSFIVCPLCPGICLSHALHRDRRSALTAAER